MSLRDRRQVEDNNGNKDNSLRSSRQRRHRGHSVPYRSISCPLEKSRKQSWYKILKGTRAEEVEIRKRKYIMCLDCICTQTCSKHNSSSYLLGSDSDAHWICWSVSFVWKQRDTSMTCRLGMCCLWRVDEGWRAASDWGDSECLHGPDSYSAQFLTLGIHGNAFPPQRRHCPILGHSTANVPNCPGAWTCTCGYTHLYPRPICISMWTHTKHLLDTNLKKTDWSTFKCSVTCCKKIAPFKSHFCRLISNFKWAFHKL